MSKRIVITGGAGFIGSQLGFSLAKLGYEVVLLDNMSAGQFDNLLLDGRPFPNIVVCDVRDAGLIRHLRGADAVFHLAGIAALPVCESQPAMAYDVNLTGTVNVLDAARKAGVRRVVFSSTSAVYERSGRGTHREDDEVRPDLVYAQTKLAAEAACRSFSANYGMDIIIPRFFNVYGPHQDFKRKSPPFTSYIARELVAGRRPTLFNRTSAARDYVYVTDVISLLTKMLKSRNRFAAELFNVASGNAYSVPQLYSIASRIAKSRLSPKYSSPERFWDSYPELFQRPYRLRRSRIREEVYKVAKGDGTKARVAFGWRPEVSVEQGMSAVIEYARRQID